MPKTVNANTIVSTAVNRNDLNRANKYLAATGYRICSVTGKLLTLTSKNFASNGNYADGFLRMSREGKALYSSGALKAAVDSTEYLPNNNSTTELV